MMTADYEIVIDGELPAAFETQFSPAEVRVAGGRTTLLARHLDQAGLHGLLTRLADLRMTLLEVRSSSVDSPGPG